MNKIKVVSVTGSEVDAKKSKIQRVTAPIKALMSAVVQKFKNIKPVSGSGKTALLAAFLLAISMLSASAQKTSVLSVLSKYNIDAAILDPNNFVQPDDYSFDLKQSTSAAGKGKTIEAKFDPSAPANEQWTVVSVDGKSPSKGDINEFRKNQSKPAQSKSDDSSFRIEKETPDYLVISSKIDAATAPKDAAFMKDCRSLITVNLKTKRVEQIQTLNEKPVKIKILSVDKLNIVTKYRWDEQAKRYFTINQNLDMQGKFLGQSLPVQTISEYSNYAKR